MAWSHAFHCIPACSLSNKQLEAVLVESLLCSRFNARVPQNKQIGQACVQTSEDLAVCTRFSLAFPSNTHLSFLESLKIVSFFPDMFSLFRREE